MRPLLVAGVRIGTYSRRQVWETEPAATYHDFRPDFGITIPRGNVTVQYESGEILSHDDKGNVASRHGIIATLKGTMENGR